MYITETERTIHNQYINVEAKKAKAKAMIIANNAYGCQTVHPSITCKYARPKVIIHGMDKRELEISWLAIRHRYDSFCLTPRFRLLLVVLRHGVYNASQESNRDGGDGTGSDRVTEENHSGGCYR